MKNATRYQKKMRKLLGSMGKAAPPQPDADPIRVMLESILEADSSAKQTQKAIAELEREFVDFNELRVSPPKEIVDRVGRDFPRARQKAMEIVTVLNGLYGQTSGLTFGHTEKMTKRDLRRHLAELGLSPYAAACMMLKLFEAHAVPVDETLVECLEMDGYIHPGSALDDVQAFLERIILQKDAPAAHELFRWYIEKSARALARRRKAKAAAEAKARAEAEAKAKAEARAARAKARAKRRAAAKAAKARKKGKSRRAKPRRAAGRTTRAKRAKRAAAAKAPARKGAAKRAAGTKTARTTTKRIAKK